MAYFEKWGYDEEVGKCVMFVYGGCQGNENRFDSEEACKARCGKQTPKPAQCTDFKDNIIATGEQYRYCKSIAFKIVRVRRNLVLLVPAIHTNPEIFDNKPLPLEHVEPEGK